MNNYNEKEEKKGGFLSALSGLFRGGSSMAGGASSGMGSAGGLGGLFASKAGIVGMVLGGATLAAGVGVVYNFIGPSSKPVYSPDLFQNSYYEEESSRAGVERAKSRDASAAASSTLDMFREQAKKDGLNGLSAEAGEGGEGGAAGDSAAAADASSDASAEAPSAPAAYGDSGAGGAPRLQANAGFGSKGGGGSSGTSIPRMQAGGGLSGGIGGQFQSVYRPPAQANGGKLSGMTASAARVKNSPKYAVPNVNKKGAYGQAKFAGKMGAKAAYSADAAGARTGATEAFSGETTGSGDVLSPETGAGMGGAGVADGKALKGSDPSLSSNDSTPPKVPDPENNDPWQAEEDAAMNGMMWALGMIVVTKLLSNIAKKLPGPWALAFYIAAMAAAAVAIFFAVKVIMAGFKMFSEYGQKMLGGIYILTGVMLALKALQALCEAAGGAGGAGSAPQTTTTTPGVNGAPATTTITAAKPPILGEGNFLQSMGGMGSMFDIGKLF
ncbi:MAG TPA: hypothetical protein DEQ38_12350 [Elusimicrobia bacterium]|nr:MAG: hypothetical protein A2089_06415 [Elusimicrobia bacterium GWD2_63_28]HCC48890.1 hypothetical protein [Elusimicrobiota bacterium]